MGKRVVWPLTILHRLSARVIICEDKTGPTASQRSRILVRERKSPALTGRTGLAYFFLFVVLATLWALPIRRPLDVPSWHEFDNTAMARNFVLEPSSFLYPRIDWRGNGPGFAESEFPLHPWLMAQCYRLWNADVLGGRILSLLAMLGALVVFAALARLLFPEPVAMLAVVLFGTNRIVNFVATALQPEAFMFFFYVCAVYAFLRWRFERSWWAYGSTIAFTSLAVLEKAPAAHVGVFFCLILFWEEGWSFLKAPRNWALGIGSLIAPALWYAHAHRLWIIYGLSLGISNEDHWIGWDIIKSARRPVGSIAIEALFVFSLGGLLLLFLAIWKRRPRAVNILLLWCASIALYFIVTVRTTGALWAWYYHVVAVPPIALLSAFGCVRAFRRPLRMRSVLAGATVSVFIVWAMLPLVAGGQTVPMVSKFLPATASPVQTLPLAIFSICAVLLIAYLVNGTRKQTSRSASFLLSATAAAGLGVYLFFSAQLIASDQSGYRTVSPEKLCATSFAPLLPAHALILTSGTTCLDYSGRRVAYDAPYMFYWLDRKGFTICIQDQTIPKVQAFADKGVSYFIAEKAAVDQVPGFRQQLEQNFRLVRDCKAASLFELRSK